MLKGEPIDQTPLNSNNTQTVDRAHFALYKSLSCQAVDRSAMKPLRPKAEVAKLSPMSATQKSKKEPP